MALGKYSRIDNRQKSSNYCSTFTIVAFVAICLVGVWMMTSSTPVPATLQSTENDVEVKQSAPEKIETEAKAFDDTQDNLPDEATKGDGGETLPDQSTGNQEPKPDAAVEEKKTNTANEEPQQTGNSEDASQSENGSNPDDGNKSIGDDVSKSEDGTNSVEDSKSGSGSNSDGDSKSDNGSNSDVDSKSDNASISDGDSQSENGSNSDGDSQSENASNSGGDSKSDIASNSDGDSKSDDGSKSGDTSKSDNVEESNKGGDDSADVSGNKVPKSENDSNSDTAENNKTSENDSQKDSVSSGVENSGESETKTGDDSAKADKDVASGEILPSSAQAELLNETTTQAGSWSTQAVESKDEKESQSPSNDKIENNWKLCNTSAGPDFIPCLDNVQVTKALQSTKHYEHRERHCPPEAPTCLVPLPEGYKTPIEWPQSRDKIWYKNVPHTQLAAYKGHQNWVKVTGEYLTFPGGGTQFTHGALHYIDFINDSLPDLQWGKRTRVILDVGCGVASFGGFLFEREVLAMSFAPKDEHEAQVQFALERGIPAFSAVMGTKRLPFPAMVFDAVHCARCRVPWHIEGGKLLLELNRVLRPGGYFIWSATPVYQKGPDDQAIWKAMKDLAKSMCWEMVSINKEKVNGVGIATFRKPSDNGCYKKRSLQSPPLCPEGDNRNAAWNVPLQACMHKVPEEVLERGSKWPEQWPERLGKAPYWMRDNVIGVYGKPEVEEFVADNSHWQRVVSKSYLNGLGIEWKSVRNVMDMRAVYGGFAAALKGKAVWVMNVVPVDSADTLPIIYERGLFGMYHDWCESFSTYPRTYDLLHADNLFSRVKKRCGLNGLAFEVDRIVRPGGKLIVRDTAEMINEVEGLMKSLRWETRMIYSKNRDGLLLLRKSTWRPSQYELLPYAV